MNWSIIFTIAIAVILLRVFILRVRSNNLRTESYRNMPSKDKLSVLKECLLNNPTQTNLQNLDEFLKSNGIAIDAEGYRPFMDRQLQLHQKKNAIAEDNDLYAQESIWMDAIRPLEFAEAEQAKADGDTRLYLERSLEGISRLYSDEATLDALETLKADYPKANALQAAYRELVEFRDGCGADDKSLEILRKKRDAWMSDLLTPEP